MKVEKFVKDRGNKYIVYIDGEKYKLYDDVIVKYSLGYIKTIDEELFKEIIEYNDEMKAYYLSIKTITNKMKCEKEIRDYLKKYDISESVIDKTILKLKEQGYLNKDIYLKAYINDAINLSNKGPLKIKNDLIKLGFNDDINDYFKGFNDDFWKTRINNIIEHKLKQNKTKSSYVIKNKIVLELQNLGYNKEIILDCLKEFKIDDKDAYKKEYEKAYKKYSSKYEGYELECKVKTYLYRKGFNLGGNYEE